MVETRKTFLPVAIPDIGEEEINEVVDSLRSGWITTGPKTKRFEEEFANYIGCKHAIAVSSCTAALHLSLVALGIGKGDEVITSPLTFASTANVIVHCGAKPVFVDIDENTYNLDPKKIESAITSRTKAIIPVHYGGQPCSMDEIIRIAKKHNLKIIEDAAHATGAIYNGRRIGTIGDTTCFSFYAIKNLTTAEGGMITTQDDALAEKLRLYSLHGMSKDAWKRYSSAGSWYYEILYPGFKYNMTDLQAALGLHQLRKLNKFIAKRKELVSLYNHFLKDAPEIILPKEMPEISHAWHLYPIRLADHKLSVERNKFIELLREKNIGTTVNFIPVHLHPYYKQTYGYNEGSFPVAEKVYQNIITLPLFTKMTADDVKYVADSIKEIIAKHKIA